MKQTRKPTHPGAILRADVIEPLGLSVTEAAARLGVTRKTLSTILNERASISPAMAVRLAKATATSAESWLNMQMKYDLWHASRQTTKVRPFPELAAA